MLRKQPFSLLLLMCLAFVVAFSVFAQNAKKTPTNKRIKALQQQSVALKKQIAESEQLLRTTKKDVSSQLHNLSIISSQITAQQELVDGFQAEVDTLNQGIAVLQKDLAKLNEELATCKRKYRRVVLYMNRNRLMQNRWTYILMSKDYRQMYRRMRFANNYSEFLRIQGETIKKTEAAVRAKQAQLQAAKNDKDTLLAEARGQQASLEEQKTKRQGIIDELNKKQSQLQSSIKQQRRQQTNLNARIDKLIQQEIAATEARRKKAEAARRAAEAKKKAEHEAKARSEANKKKNSTGKKTEKTKNAPKKKSYESPKYEEEDVVDRTVSSNFQANRGRLPVPITGSYAITGRYGRYNVEDLSGVTLDNKGINLTGRAGAQARCVFDGEVTTIANFGGTYTVIVRHGSYFSVYSNLSSVSVRRGQSVNTRQTLGNVAKDANGGHTLHFQLRKRSGSSANHLNPLPWLVR